MRPMTTLKPNTAFRLPKGDQRSGFIALYNTQLGTNVYDFAFQLVTRLLWPWTGQENADVSAKSIKDFAAVAIADKSRRITVRSTLRKNTLNKTIEFRAPIFHCMAASDMNYLIPSYAWVNSYKIPSVISIDAKREIKESVKTVDDTVFAGGAMVSGDRVVQICGFGGRVADILKKCLLHVEAEIVSGKFILFATWRISQAEAEFLNNVPFAQIKLGNLYPTLLEWASSVFGKEANLPDTICPITTITSEVEAVKAQRPVTPRVGINGIVMDINREFVKIPADVNNANDYEQQLMDFGLQEDGSYSWYRAQGNEGGPLEVRIGDVATRKLPTNMPIYADWLNDKFVYSNTAGNLAVYDLSNTVPVSNFHLKTLLHSEVNNPEDPNWAILSTAVNLASTFNRALFASRPVATQIPNLTPNAVDFITSLSRKTYSKFEDAVTDGMRLWEMTNGGSREDKFFNKHNSEIFRIHQMAQLPQLQWLFEICANALGTLQANIEVMYSRYSVMNVLHQLAVLELVVEYSPRHAEVEQADAEERDVYLNQGVDPDHPVEAVPQIKQGLRYQPHQAKVQNLTRKGPKLVVYPIDAGGGKTIVILTNVLLELKRKLCKRPVIVCPSHLVAQYVKEVVYVTEGRLNVIPVTNASFKSHGEEKLAQFIENAPINTVVVTDMNFLKGRRQRVAYGNKTVEIYRNAEFMRQFEFDLVAVDEVHYLKNRKSSRRDAAARFIQDIPMKRIASGTIISDTMLDLVSQIALLDPAIFGSEEQFKRDYALKQSGAKVLAWKPGAEAEMRRKIAEHCVVAGARRKEWAALLPKKTEKFRGVELTKNQRLLYESILQETMELIQEAMARDAEVRDMMESEDDSKAEELEAKLRPYLARLERFLSAPAEDQAADLFLTNQEDRLSPKLNMIYEICREHLRTGLPGKILVFTQYTASAEAVAMNAPPDLAPHFIHYTADRKAECKTEFEFDENKKIMVGVSSSMDTGLNLQFASRLIRMETVWTPGVLEQGNSRVFRPELKGKETRDEVFFDWIIVNRTIDITKTARLVSKIISKSKFDEYDNDAYAEVPDLPQVQMTMESIAANNDFTEELVPYLEGYQTLQQLEQSEFERYKQENGDNLIPVDVPVDGLLEDSKLMSRVPYVPEMELYGVDKLGLIRYDHFVRQDMSALEDDESEVEDSDDDSEDEGDANDPKSIKRAAIKAQLLKERALAMNCAAHTDFGDGTIVYVGPKRVKIRMADGTVVRVFKLQTYIIRRSTTNGRDMRSELLKQVGQIPLDAPIVVPVEEGVQDKKRKLKKVQERQEAPPQEPTGPVAEFDFTVMNDFLALMYRGKGEDRAVVDILQGEGFQVAKEYKYVKIMGPIVMLAFFRALKAAGFSLDPRSDSSELKRIYEALRSNKKAMSTFGFATSVDIRNFFRSQIKPISDPTRLVVYPLVQDGQLYMLFPTKGIPANQKASRVQVKGIIWRSSQDLEMLKLFGTKAEAVSAVKKLLEAGISIPEDNLKELKQQFQAIRLVNR